MDAIKKNFDSERRRAFNSLLGVLPLREFVATAEDFFAAPRRDLVLPDPDGRASPADAAEVDLLTGNQSGARLRAGETGLDRADCGFVVLEVWHVRALGSEELDGSAPSPMCRKLNLR